MLRTGILAAVISLWATAALAQTSANVCGQAAAAANHAAELSLAGRHQEAVQLAAQALKACSDNDIVLLEQLRVSIPALFLLSPDERQKTMQVDAAVYKKLLQIRPMARTNLVYARDVAAFEAAVLALTAHPAAFDKHPTYNRTNPEEALADWLEADFLKPAPGPYFQDLVDLFAAGPRAGEGKDGFITERALEVVELQARRTRPAGKTNPVVAVGAAFMPKDQDRFEAIRSLLKDTQSPPSPTAPAKIALVVWLHEGWQASAIKDAYKPYRDKITLAYNKLSTAEQKQALGEAACLQAALSKSFNSAVPAFLYSWMIPATAGACHEDTGRVY